MSRDRREEQFQLLSRDSSLDSLDGLDPLQLEEGPLKYTSRPTLRRILSPGAHRAIHTPLKAYRHCRLYRRSIPRWALSFLLVLIVFTGLFRPSYTHLPPHYQALQERALTSQEPGRANPNNEKIFICISLYDKGGKLAGGQWGQQLLDVIDLLGPENTFLSIYENGSGEAGAKALRELEAKVPCEKDMVFEDVDKNSFPKITLPDGQERVKRLVYLSDIRNRALRPLDKDTGVKYDKILFLNDVFFHPIEATQLLFSTNQRPDGKADYVAACAIDFYEDPVKFYDAFASRDFGGYSMGVPFYPFFSSAGDAGSRHDILAQKDAVRVKSCWSGMAVFDAEPFQSKEKEIPKELLVPGSHNIDPVFPVPVQAPVRFRAEPEIFFDACECCLLVADALKVTKGKTNFEDDNHIYMNPYVRVAYSPKVLSWLHLTRRFERLYSPIQWFVNTIAFMPTWNPHRAVQEGDNFNEEVWIPTNGTLDGHWEIQERVGRNGMYCGVREMQILRLTDKRYKDRNWEKVSIPSGRSFF
ncbi:MAG: hypothetical protein MMC23_008368 [Stictis urceolatum]|nr:hypothetical protein [Stictis urceolata]